MTDRASTIALTFCDVTRCLLSAKNFVLPGSVQRSYIDFHDVCMYVCIYKYVSDNDLQYACTRHMPEIIEVVKLMINLEGI